MRLRDLDDALPLAEERAEAQRGRPDACTCLGAGGLGGLIAVVSSGVPIFERYCEACVEGERAREAAAWAAEYTQRQEHDSEDTETTRALRDRELDLLERSGIGRRYRSCTFEAFRALLAQRGFQVTEVLDRAMQEREDGYGRFEPVRGDYIYAPPGYGKTSIAISALRAWIARGRAGMFVRASDLGDAIRASYGRHDGEGDRLLDRVRSAPLLVLDDLGMVTGSPSDRAKIISVLVSRHAEGDGKLTICTSNYPPAEVARRLSGDDVTEAKRLEGRLLEMCDIWRLDTTDLRTGRREDVLA